MFVSCAYYGKEINSLTYFPAFIILAYLVSSPEKAFNYVGFFSFVIFCPQLCLAAFASSAVSE